MNGRFLLVSSSCEAVAKRRQIVYSETSYITDLTCLIGLVLFEGRHGQSLLTLS